MQEHGDGVIRVDRLADAVCYWLDLRFEGPEQAIPNDECTRVVLVPILSVRAVMHPVVRGRVEDILDRSWKLPDDLRVQYRLELLDKDLGQQNQNRVISQHYDGEGEKERKHRVEGTEAVGHRHVEVG